MSVTETPEYRQLALDSSNDMMRYDALRGAGEYEQAALYIRNAGLARARMAQIMLGIGEFEPAAEDWLSAAACFKLATDAPRMRDSIEQARNLVGSGFVSSNRRDLLWAIAEREREQSDLDQKIAHYRQTLEQLLDPMSSGQQSVLDFLLTQRCELPGSSLLYAHIWGQAMQLGNRTLAEKSLGWAQQFDPTSSHLGALRVSQLFAFGDHVRAAELGRKLLERYPDMGYIRILLAQTLAFRTGSQATHTWTTDWESALEVLHPLIEKESVDPNERLTALSLATMLRHGLGHTTEYRKLLDFFDMLAESLHSPSGVRMAAALRQSLPDVFPNPNTSRVLSSTNDGLHPLGEADYSTLRRLFEQFNPLTAVGSAA